METRPNLRCMRAQLSRQRNGEIFGPFGSGRHAVAAEAHRQLDKQLWRNTMCVVPPCGSAGCWFQLGSTRSAMSQGHLATLWDCALPGAGAIEASFDSCARTPKPKTEPP